MNIKGVVKQKDKTIEQLSHDVFTKLDKIANPEGAKKPIIAPSGLSHFSIEDALRELSELKKKQTS